MIVSESEKPLAADSISRPLQPAVEVPAIPTATDVPSDWEPLTPEVVEDEAIRGDFMLRWAVVFLALLIGCRQIVETTTLVHVKTGQYLASHGFWPPTNDVFSSTAGKYRWVNLSWLWDLMASGLFAVGDGIGLSLATALLVATTWWLIGKTNRVGVSSWFGSILSVLALLACHPQFSGQPETVTLFGLAATMWWLHAWRSSSDATASASQLAVSGKPVSLWWFVPGFVLWSNLDNRMFLGLALLLLWGAGEAIGKWFGRATLSAAQRKTFWKILGTCVVASCLNPFGGQSLVSAIELYAREYPAWRFSASSNSSPDETGAFSLLTPDLWRSGVGRLPLVAGVVVLLASFASVGLNFRRASLGDVLALVGFVVFALIASHELAAASLVACVIGTLNAQQWYQSNFRQGYSIAPKELLFTRGGRAITVLAFFGLAVMAVNQSLFEEGGKRIGVGLSNSLRGMIDSYREATADSLDDRPFNFVPRQGDVLLWIGQKPFLDSRLSLFARPGEVDLIALHDQTRNSLVTVSNASSDSDPDRPANDRPEAGWQKVFDHFQLTHAMPRLVGASPKSYFRLLMNPSWRLTHLGAHCAVFYRQDQPSPELKQYLEQHQLSLLKLAFQTKEPSAVRIDWPRVRTSVQNWLSPPEVHVSNKVLEAENLLMHLRGMAAGELAIDQPMALAMAHVAIRKANAGLAESVDDVEAYRILGEVYSFLLAAENAIEQQGGISFENRLRFYQALAAYYQAIRLAPRSVYLRDRLLELWQRHNRVDLALRELRAIDELSPVKLTDTEQDENARQRRAAMRDHCESRLALLQERISPALNDGQSPGELASQMYSAGFVLEALNVLNRDQDAVKQSPELQVLQNLLRFEAGEIEEVYGVLEFESESNPAAWRLPAAWTRLAHGEYDRAIELWSTHLNQTRLKTVTTILATLPIVQSPFHLLGHPNVWPTHHGQMLVEAQRISDTENSALLWYTAMSQLEGGNPQLAGKTMTGLLEASPETPLRPLIRSYLLFITDELIDLEPPSEWIPIDSETFTPDEPIDAGKK